MNSEGHGRLDFAHDRPEIEFDRVLEAGIDAVWAMLTTADGLEKWLAPARVDLRVGGTMDIDFGDGGVVGGEIIDLVPGAVLEFHWRFTGEPDSIIRFELQLIDADTTRLRLHHRLLPTDQAVGYGAGWHAHLDVLASAVGGGPAVDWDERLASLLPEYAEQVA